MDGMMIPFIMLLIVTVALLLERRHHEAKIVDIYEQKFEQWKEHDSDVNKERKSCKQLAGLVFLEDEQLTIEVMNEKAIDKLSRKKYTIKV